MTSAPTLSTDGTTFVGTTDGGADAFLGIRYGGDVAGRHRFRPAGPWGGAREVESAQRFGPAAPQSDPRIGHAPLWADALALMYPSTGTPTEGIPTDENCLSLNVWRPHRPESDDLPALVWFHGGGFLSGAGSEGLFNGAALAASGRAVVITVTHRLGALGHLALEHLPGGEDFAGSASAGLHDLVLALRWIREKASSLRIDPERVTIAGQSGGGQKVLHLTGMPSAAGLFSRAVVMSTMVRPFTVEDGVDAATRLLSTLGVASPRDLLTTPAAEIVRAQASMQDAVRVFRPIPGTADLPFAGFTDPAAGAVVAPVPLLVGHCTHDSALMLTQESAYPQLDHAAAQRSAADRLGDDGESYRAARAAHPSESAPLTLARVVTEHSFGRVAGDLATAASRTGVPTYSYRFDVTTDVLGGVLGSCHSLDLPYLFRTVAGTRFTGSRPSAPASDAMSSDVLDFIEGSAPGTRRGMPWRPHDPDAPAPHLVTASVRHRPTGADHPTVSPMKASA